MFASLLFSGRYWAIATSLKGRKRKSATGHELPLIESP
jgi:hypothetical protein